MFGRLAVGLGALVGMCLLVWALASQSATEPRPTASESLTPVQAVLRELSLQPSDLGLGWSVSLAEKGNRLSRPSLSFCDGDFPSEGKRLVRRLTESVAADGRSGHVTTDVVQYESIPAALEALAEVRIESALCPDSGPQRVLPLEVTALPTTADAFAAQVESHSGESMSLRSTLWQVRGNVLVILSLVVTPSESDYDSEWSEFRRLALLLTDRLNAMDPVEIGYF